MLTILSRMNMKKWECFSMSVWALAQPAMQQETHLMFQSEARFSAGPHFSFVPACRFQHRAQGLLSLAPHHLEVVLIPTNPSGPTGLSLSEINQYFPQNTPFLKIAYILKI